MLHGRVQLGLERVAVSNLKGLLHACQGCIPPLLQPVKLDGKLPGKQIQGLTPEEAEHHLPLPVRRLMLAWGQLPHAGPPGRTLVGLQLTSAHTGLTSPPTWSRFISFSI